MICKVRQIRDDVRVVYCFFNGNKRKFGAGFMLFEKDGETWIHLLLSKGHFSIYEFKQLWSFIKQAVNTEYICFEVVPEDGSVYKHFLKIDGIEKGYIKFDEGDDKIECEIIRVRSDAKIRYFT